MAAWSRKIWKINCCDFFRFFKRPLTGDFSKFCSKRIVVFKFREIWPTGNRWSRALLTSPSQKKTKFRQAVQLSLLRGSRPKSAWVSPGQCTQSAPDFIQIRSLSAELYPNAWTPSERVPKWRQYSAEAYSFEPNKKKLKNKNRYSSEAKVRVMESRSLLSQSRRRKGVQGGKDLWNRQFLRRQWKSEEVMNDQSGESTEENDVTGMKKRIWRGEIGSWFQRQLRWSLWHCLHMLAAQNHELRALSSYVVKSWQTHPNTAAAVCNNTRSRVRGLQIALYVVYAQYLTVDWTTSSVDAFHYFTAV